MTKGYNGFIYKGKKYCFLRLHDAYPQGLGNRTINFMISKPSVAKIIEKLDNAEITDEPLEPMDIFDFYNKDIKKIYRCSERAYIAEYFYLIDLDNKQMVLGKDAKIIAEVPFEHIGDDWIAKYYPEEYQMYSHL